MMKNKLQRSKTMGKKKKSRAFSIYLLKAGVEIAANALKEGHGLHLLEEGNHTSFRDGQQMEIYLSKGRSTPPWWRSSVHALAPRNSSTSLFQKKYFSLSIEILLGERCTSAFEVYKCPSGALLNSLPPALLASSYG